MTNSNSSTTYNSSNSSSTRHSRTLIFVAIMAFYATACGKPDSPAPTAISVAAKDKLPACASKTRAQLYFVEDEKAFYVCRDNGWETITLQGPAGANGKDGASATASTLFSQSITCGGQLQNTTLWFSYQAAVLKSQDVLVTGSIRDGSIETSRTAFYAKTQNGAATASVTVSNDFQQPYNGGFWTLSLNRTTLVTSIVYQDADVAGGSTGWTMTPDKCVVNNYP